MGERRKFPRLSVALEASYLVEGSVLGRRATLSGVSAGGAAFVTEEAIEPGLTLDYLRFSLGEEPNPRQYKPAAVVVSSERREGIGRAHEYVVAVEFTNLTLEEVRLLHEFVVARLDEGGQYNPRFKIEKPVAIRFDRFETFVQEVSQNLSRTGMFIRSEQPREVGSEFDFVLQLGEDFSLVQGRAEVVWTRLATEGPDRPPGMGIRFLGLDKTSENVLHRLIHDRLEPSYPREIGPRTDADELPTLLDGDPEEPAVS